ncbi:ribosomal protein S18 acetylase RimI-like enzyme [Mesorhizobium soli]|uniref:GNAT family N-acetyltransferase n=1 Tax=Pseudaminobacter soli (ex Li et al. 2025) TaxID=1295366 RepID=UPI0024743BF1|nr:GNAT family N-acetyltransferase [Mesorhizobium soli]MDH6234886.1 ribosomal protein S18 acetylase RimI-like enzyme [Mesorhizobium soli]
MKIALRLLELDEIAPVDGIELDEGDEDFAGGNMERVLERVGGPDIRTHHPFVIIVAREVVGFFMLREGSALPPWADPDAITVHNFRISKQMQWKGYGTAALVLAARWVAVRRAGVAKLMLSVNVDNTGASRLYLRCGFKDLGLPLEGRLGTEVVLSCSMAELAAKHVPVE